MKTTKSAPLKVNKDLLKSWGNKDAVDFKKFKFYSKAYKTVRTFKRTNFKSLMFYKHNKETYKLLALYTKDWIFKRYKYKNKANIYNAIYLLVVSICNRFMELMINDLIENNDYFVFPRGGFGHIVICPHNPSQKNYVNFLTNHKRVNLKFIPGPIAWRFVRYPYIYFSTQYATKRIIDKIKDGFKYTYNGKYKLQTHKSKRNHSGVQCPIQEPSD